MKALHRRRDGPAAATTIQHLTPFSGLLWRVAHKIAEPPRPPKAGRRKGLCKVTDEQVREMRRLHEREHVTAAQLAVRYGLAELYVKDLINYRVRLKYTTNAGE